MASLKAVKKTTKQPEKEEESYEFNIPERVKILDYCARRDKLFFKAVAKELREKIDFSPEEIKRGSIEVDDKRTWSWRENFTVAFKLTEYELMFLHRKILQDDELEDGAVDDFAFSIAEQTNMELPSRPPRDSRP